ncbi:replication endonuclease, partial [Vibrio anguillarum]|nr:replication endonuclease [Vibrio anguillarum]
PSKFERNTYLRVTTDNIARKLSIPLSKLELNLSEDDLRAKAKHLAKSTLALRRQYLDDELALYPVRLFVQQQGINQTTVSYSLNGELSRYG